MLAGEIVMVVKLHTSRLAEILVEIPDDFFLVLGIYEPSEPHILEFLDIVLLVGAVRGLGGSLDLKHGPALVTEHQEVRNALNIIRVVLQDHGLWEQSCDLLDQLTLILVLAHAHVGSFRECDKRYRESSLSRLPRTNPLKWVINWVASFSPLCWTCLTVGPTHLTKYRTLVLDEEFS